MDTFDSTNAIVTVGRNGSNIRGETSDFLFELT